VRGGNILIEEIEKEILKQNQEIVLLEFFSF
jgi:hypothetical protein